MAKTPSPSGDPGGSSVSPRATSTSKALRTTQIIVVGSVMFSFISFWKTAAVVLCDLASTSYYIGGIAESAIGKAAPWFILAVMLFSYAVRSVYIESCSMFVRGGVYRVVREAMGGFMGKLAVSALLFDYILTGPISSVTAGQYIVGFVVEMMNYGFGFDLAKYPDVFDWVKSYGSCVFAIAVTIYFYRQNVVGIHESADKAFKIMVATTVMAVLMIGWCGTTIALRLADKDTPAHMVPKIPPIAVDLSKKTEIDETTKAVKPKINPITGEQVDPLGFLPHLLPESAVETIRNQGTSWFHWIGLFGILVAFGHSILAMSGEETLAQVYREVESPKLPNFKKAALVVFVYSLLLTATISFMAVMLIPDDVRMTKYADNLIGGLAMNVSGHPYAKLALNGFVVVVGGLILSGAVNTAIIGSNGVLNRVAEDGVVPVWLQKPHPKYGTTYRMLRVILALKILIILVSQGNVLMLGEAYAFGVVWSFVFMSMSMVILRYRQPKLPREYRVPLNIPFGSTELPVGLIFVFMTLLLAALVNLVTKEVATVSGLVFTFGFLSLFVITERVNRGKSMMATGEAHPKHVDQFNVQTSMDVTTESLGLKKPFTKLVAIRSPHNLFMLEKALAETDPETTSVVVMTAKVLPEGDATPRTDLDMYDQQLMTAVVEKAEKAGKKVKPLIVPTNNPLHAILRLADELKAQEVILGASNKYAADEHMEQIALYWMNLHQGDEAKLTVRLLSRDRDIYLDLAGGNRIPKISERQARTVAELRAAGVGIDRVLLVHDGTQQGSDLFQNVLTMLDAQVVLGVAHIPHEDASAALLAKDVENAKTLGRDAMVHAVPPGEFGPDLVDLARESAYDLVILPRPSGPHAEGGSIDFVLQHAHCPIFLAAPPPIPADVAG